MASILSTTTMGLVSENRENQNGSKIFGDNILEHNGVVYTSEIFVDIIV